MDTTNPQAIPIIGFAAYSGTGKTTLVKQLIQCFVEKGYRVGIIKQSHHDFEIDIPGKDSYELRQAGAQQVIVASRKRWALMVETPEKEADPNLVELLQHLDSDALDLILVEGFRHDVIPKIEVYRQELSHPLICKEDSNVIAIATDNRLEVAARVPELDLNNPQEIAGFIQKEMLD